MPKYKPVSEQIRELVRDCGVTRYGIAKATGISESALSRFLSGERGLSMQALDTLGAYLGLQVTIGKHRRGSSTQSKR